MQYLGLVRPQCCIPLTQYMSFYLAGNAAQQAESLQDGIQLGSVLLNKSYPVGLHGK